MNTFLPYSSFKESADCLDKKRCFKQVVEASQIINVLEGKSVGWKNHPAVKMWIGYTPALIEYYNTFWQVCKDKWKIRFNKLQPISNNNEVIYPQWLGDETFHSLMRANLLRKNKEYYSQFNWTEQPAEGYYWPRLM